MFILKILFAPLSLILSLFVWLCAGPVSYTHLLPARNQPAAVRLLRIFGVVDDVADGLSHRAAFAGVQGHQALSLIHI